MPAFQPQTQISGHFLAVMTKVPIHVNDWMKKGPCPTPRISEKITRNFCFSVDLFPPQLL
jgi:hypothetical protein